DLDSPRAVLPMNWGEAGGGRITRDFLGVHYETYVSPATGGREIRWLGTPNLSPEFPVTLRKPRVQLRRPRAYWVPVTKTEVISRLKWHGIRMEILPEARSVRLEMYRLVNPKPQPGERFHP